MKIISIWNTSNTRAIPIAGNQPDFLSSNINLRRIAAITPAKKVDIEQAMAVNALSGFQRTVNARNPPPIKPETIPATGPKIKPAEIGEASLTFIVAPQILTPNKEAYMAEQPKRTPIINSL